MAGCNNPAEIINLNVGGQKFSTSRDTLTWSPDSFFGSLLSGRVPSLRDDTGAIFIDRDPKLFALILNFLRTKEISPSGVDISALRHEAEFYGIASLVKRLILCEDLDHSGCGDVLFHGCIHPPSGLFDDDSVVVGPSHPPLVATMSRSRGENGEAQNRHSWDVRLSSSCHPAIGGADVLSPNSLPPPPPSAHGRRHSRHSSAEYRQIKTDLGFCIDLPRALPDPAQVNILQGHHNWIAVAYSRVICCFKAMETTGWSLIFTSPRTEGNVERIAMNSKVLGTNNETKEKLVAISYGNFIRLWCIQDSGQHASSEIGIFDMRVHVDALFFIGSQLVSTSSRGKVGVWHAMTQNFQIQDVAPITSFDTAGSFLLLGCNNGSIYYVDMQKFPLRMKDNDLLVTELYKDPNGDAITALSVYLTPKTTLSGNWIEIAYGTSAGTVRVIVQHPETVGSGPQLFQDVGRRRTWGSTGRGAAQDLGRHRTWDLIVNLKGTSVLGPPRKFSSFRIHSWTV